MQRVCSNHEQSICLSLSASALAQDLAGGGEFQHVSVIMVPGSPLPDWRGNGEAQSLSRCSILWTLLSQETSRPMPKNVAGLKQVTALSVLTLVLLSTSKCIQGQT